MIADNAGTADAAVMVSISMASTTLSRVAAENTGASLVLAAVEPLHGDHQPHIRGLGCLGAAHERHPASTGGHASVKPWSRRR